MAAELHEPECWMNRPDIPNMPRCSCNPLRAAYKRGREDAAEAVLRAAWNANGTIGLLDQRALYAAAWGGEQG